MSWCSDRKTIAGKRDYALLMLLWGNTLRRNEISLLNINDFDPDARTLQILGKGRGTQSEVVDLGDATVEVIAYWLSIGLSFELGGKVTKVLPSAKYITLPKTEPCSVLVTRLKPPFFRSQLLRLCLI